MGVSLRERLREDSEESEDELVVFDQDEIEVVGKGDYVGHGRGMEGHEGDDDDNDKCDMGEDHEECGCGGEDDRAGELLCFLMKLQAAAMESFGGGGDAGSAVDFDPKLYVDLPLKGSLQVTAAAFNALPRGTTGSVEPGSC